METKIVKTSEEYYYCKTCKVEFSGSDLISEGMPISGTYWVSPCCSKDVHWNDDERFEEKERNVIIKKFVSVKDLLGKIQEVREMKIDAEDIWKELENI